MKKILFIGGSFNQTTIAHQIAQHLEADYDCYFSPFYADTGLLRRLQDANLLGFTIMGGKFRAQTETYLRDNDLSVDYRGVAHDYDLVVTLSDLVIQDNVKDKPLVLVQEGMTDPENFMYHLVRRFGLPRFLASTSTAGLSDAYDVFCVASEGYRDLFAQKGVDPAKMLVTGIPNYDNAAQFLDNDFPHRGYVLAATSDMRETFKFENRTKFIRRVVEIADGRSIIFKLHPNEWVKRAVREIKSVAPEAMVYADGNTDHMIANCDVLVTQYSTVVYIGLALGKEVHSYFDLDMLKRLLPNQNGGTSAKSIAAVCRDMIEHGYVRQETAMAFRPVSDQESAASPPVY